MSVYRSYVQVNDVAFGIINKKTNRLSIFYSLKALTFTDLLSCWWACAVNCCKVVAAVAHLDALLLRLWGLLLRLELTEI